ncbi:DUF3349 domain-containing protein [Nocardia paucivorans]|uniref:DUF3349 domain-containing protein n=1 Tax=Nocardia paucivorans TaxID=114259 RepID=UPI00031D9FC9|nr:DUF3349 domain-containing protein [Nocardia paucivorans]
MAENTDRQRRPGWPARVIAWLRAGYPQGVPQTDYVALFAILHRNLTEQEVVSIAEQLVRDRGDREITRDEIEAAVHRMARERPGADDIARVASHLAAGGWPLAAPSDELSDEER